MFRSCLPAGLAAAAVLALGLSTAAKAADIAVAEEPASLGWYLSIFGGPKWGDGDVDLSWARENNVCQAIAFVCAAVEPIITRRNGELHGEVDNGFLFGAALGAQVTDNLRAEIEVSHARLDTETEAFEYVSYAPTVGTAYSTSDEDHLKELFILANVWFGIPVSSMFSPYVGGGVGVAHVDANFGVANFSTGAAPGDSFAASIDADGWNFAYQLGAGLLIGLSENIAIDVGYRFKAIPNVDLDDPEFCEHCYPKVTYFDADDDFDIHEHVAQIGITFGF